MNRLSKLWKNPNKTQYIPKYLFSFVISNKPMFYFMQICLLIIRFTSNPEEMLTDPHLTTLILD